MTSIQDYNQNFLDNLPILKSHQIYCITNTLNNTYFSIYSTNQLKKHFEQNPEQILTHRINLKNSLTGNFDNE